MNRRTERFVVGGCRVALVSALCYVGFMGSACMSAESGAQNEAGENRNRTSVAANSNRTRVSVAPQYTRSRDIGRVSRGSTTGVGLRGGSDDESTDLADKRRRNGMDDRDQTSVSSGGEAEIEPQSGGGDRRVINGGFDGVEMMLEAEGLDMESTYALQVVPWVNSHLGIETMSLFEYDPEQLRAQAEERFGEMLDGYYATHGNYPPFAYVDNDRFYPRRKFWNWALADLPGGVMRYGDVSRTAEEHTEAAAVWFDSVVRGMQGAVYERDARTQVSIWGQPNARIAHNDNYAADVMSAGTLAYENLDYVMPNVYLEGNLSTTTLEDLRVRTGRVVDLAAQMKPGAPRYVTIRLLYPPNAGDVAMRMRPVEPEKLQAIVEAAYDAGAEGILIWEGVPSGSVGQFVPEAMNIIESRFRNE